MTESNQLLNEFARKDSEGAFRQLVARYVDLVYSTALRRAGGDAHRAEDIVQIVFTDLARKAATLPADVMLGGWLHRHCCFVASNVHRAEGRRIAREQEALAMENLHPSNESTWSDLAPELDEAIERLDEEDRNAIVLRFFERRDFRAIGEALGATENAAQKRVARAVEKLRELLVERGVAISVTGIISLLLTQSLVAAPVSLAGKASARALQSGAKTAVTASGIGVLAVMVFIALAFTVLVGAYISFSPGNVAERIGAAVRNRGEVDRTSTGASPAGQLAENSIVSDVTASSRSAADSNVLTLRLTIVAADSGRVIPNVPLSYKSIEGEKWITKEIAASRDGVCVVSYSTNAASLELVTRVEGFADTRLNWEKKRGDVIPEAYTLKLKRGVKIGGKVLNARDELVRGATVHLDSVGGDEGYQVESMEFGGMSILTEDGTWETERMAATMLTRIFGDASHPDYADSDHISQGDVQAAQLLRASQHVFHLAEGARVRGIVVNERNEPVAGAKVLVGRVNVTGSREEKVGSSGRFAIGGCVAGKTLLTATAKGYAATTINAVANESGKEYKLVLKPGTILKLRVVGPSGEPIPKAYVWLDTGMSLDYEANTNKPLAQVYTNFRTDAEGRVRWDDAPEQDLAFDIDAKGYMRLNGVKANADGIEHTFTMNPGLKVHGTVTDASTGLPIPKFRVIAGYPSKTPGFTNWNVHWSTFDRHWIPGVNGRFEQSFEEPIVHGVAEDRFMFKVEAEGYKTAITRAVEANERDVEFNFALRGDASKLTVVGPDGRPAPDTEVSSRRRTGIIFLRDFTIARIGDDLVRTADENGQTVLDIEAGEIVIASGQRGFAIAKAAEIESTRVIQLQPWGRVEGRITGRGQPVKDWKITVNSDVASAGVNLITGNVLTDAEGKFVFPFVPPLPMSVIRMIPTSPNSWTHDRLRDLQIAPGETARVDYDDHGVTLAATLRLPSKLSPAEQIYFSVRTKMPTPPAGLTNGPALTEWYARPENVAAGKRARERKFVQGVNGVWICEGVRPGDWVIDATVFELSSEPKFQPRTVATARTEIQISEDSPERIDLGELILNEAPQAQAKAP